MRQQGGEHAAGSSSEEADSRRANLRGRSPPVPSGGGACAADVASAPRARSLRVSQAIRGHCTLLPALARDVIAAGTPSSALRRVRERGRKSGKRYVASKPHAARTVRCRDRRSLRALRPSTRRRLRGTSEIGDAPRRVHRRELCGLLPRLPGARPGDQPRRMSQSCTPRVYRCAPAAPGRRMPQSAPMTGR